MHYRRRTRFVAIVVAAVVTASLLSFFPTITAAFAFVLGFFSYGVVAGLIAWIGRCRYWYSRGTNGQKTWDCPNCHSRRHRTGGDFVPRCHRCGWQPGWSGLRWLRHSVFARQLGRTLSLAPLRRFVIIFLAAAIVVAMTTGTGVAIIDKQLPSSESGESVVASLSGSTQSPTATIEETETRDQTETPTPQPSHGGYNVSMVGRHFTNLLNAERRERGLQEVSQRDVLTDMGEAHSAVMAREDEIGHVEPDGTTIEDRYDSRGLLPECRLSIPESNEFYPGAENAAQTWIEQEVITGSGSTYISSEKELAEELLRQWMNSPPHRKPMLLPGMSQVGLGINISDSGKVYASLEMC